MVARYAHLSPAHRHEAVDRLVEVSRFWPEKAAGGDGCERRGTLTARQTYRAGMAELGRRARLKIWCPQGRGGSIPPPGTTALA
jgi:hypothetical protein